MRGYGGLRPPEILSSPGLPTAQPRVGWEKKMRGATPLTLPLFEEPLKAWCLGALVVIARFVTVPPLLGWLGSAQRLDRRRRAKRVAQRHQEADDYMLDIDCQIER